MRLLIQVGFGAHLLHEISETWVRILSTAKLSLTKIRVEGHFVLACFGLRPSCLHQVKISQWLQHSGRAHTLEIAAREVVGSHPTAWRAFFLFLSFWQCVLKQAPSGGAT